MSEFRVTQRQNPNRNVESNTGADLNRPQAAVSLLSLEHNAPCLTVTNLLTRGLPQEHAPEPAKKPSLLATGFNVAQDYIWRPETESQLHIRDEISHYSSSILKTAALFAKGNAAIGAAALLFAADEVRYGDTLKNQGIDAALGLTKGAAIKLSLNYFGKLEWNPAAKGVAIGTTSRLFDNVLNRQNYLSYETGEFAPELAPSRIINKGLNFEAMLMDGAIFMAGDKMLGLAGTGSRLNNSEFWKSTLGGTFFGLSSGAGGEYIQQRQRGEFDPVKIAMRALLQGGADTLGGALAGRYNMRFHESRVSPGEKPAEKRLAQNDQVVETLVRSGGNAPALDLMPRPAQNLPALKALMGTPEVVREQVKLAPLADAVISSDYQAYRAALPQETVDMHVYKPKGLPEVAIERNYDIRLNEIRDLRFAANKAVSPLDTSGQAARDVARRALESHPLRDALLPEEALPSLATMPSTTRRVTISERANPDDAYYARLHGDPHFQSLADASTTGENTLFRPRRSSLDHSTDGSIRAISIHEWSHQLRWQRPDAARQFDRASGLEPDLLASNYQRSSGDEAWSKNLSDLLHSDTRVMIATAERLPLRSLVLARAVAEHLNSLPLANRSKYHDVYLQRTQMIEAIAGTRARDLLVAHMQVSRDATQASAGRLLLDLGFENSLSDLGAVPSLDLSHSSAGDSAVARLAGLPIESMRLSGTSITDGAGPLLARMPRLQTLRVDGNRVTDGLLQHIAALPSLRTLYAANTNMTADGHQVFSRLRPDVHVIK